MLNKKAILFIVMIIGLLFAGNGLVLANRMVEQRGVLSGSVTQVVVTAGTQVREGDILIRVKTLTGSQPAARATVDGTVSEVLVGPGDYIEAGQVVARIAVNHK